MPRKKAAKKAPAKKKKRIQGRGRGRVGAPTKCGTSYSERLLEALRGGNYAETACKLAGVSDTAYYEWLAKGQNDLEKGQESVYADFVVAHELALAEPEARALAIVREAAEGWTEKRTEHTVDGDGTIEKTVEIEKRDWRAAERFLERRYHQRWGPRQEVHHEGEIKIKRVRFGSGDRGDPFESSEKG